MLGSSEELPHWKAKGHEVAAVDLTERHLRRCSVVGFEVGTAPFGLEACLAVAEVLEEGIAPSGLEAYLAVAEVLVAGTAPSGLEACLAEAGIDLVECFVVAGRPWRFVEGLLEEVHLLVLGPCPVVDGLLLLRQRQSFGHLLLLDHRDQQTRCLRNFLHERLLGEHRIRGRKYCH